jgi:excisionase family DNA binding protein
MTLTNYLTTAQVAARYGCSRQWVCQLIKDGRIPGEMVGGRWLVKLTDLEALEVQGKEE